MISSGDASYLRAVANAGATGFAPLGQLYLGILSDIAERGLLFVERNGSFFVSQYGYEQLAEYEDANGGVQVERLGRALEGIE